MDQLNAVRKSQRRSSEAATNVQKMAKTEKAACIAAEKRVIARADKASKDKHRAILDRKASLNMLESQRKAATAYFGCKGKKTRSASNLKRRRPNLNGKKPQSASNLKRRNHLATIINLSKVFTTRLNTRSA